MKTQSRVQHAPRRNNGMSFAERLVERKARWPVFAQKYVPQPDADARAAYSTSHRSPVADRLLQMGAPEDILETHARQITYFSGLHLDVQAGRLAPKKAALRLIQHHGFPRWIKSELQPGVLVCGVSALIRRLNLDVDPSILQEVHSILCAPRGTLQAQEV